MIVEADFLVADESFPEAVCREGDGFHPDPHDPGSHVTLRRLYETLPSDCRAVLGGRRAALLDDRDTFYVWRAAYGDDRMSRLPAPKATLAVGETATFSFDGHQLTVGPSVSKDRTAIQLKIAGTYEAPDEPACRHDLSIPDGKHLLFRLGPWVEEREASRVTMPLLPRMRLGTTETILDPQCLLVLLTVRIADEPEDDAPAASAVQND